MGQFLHVGGEAPILEIWPNGKAGTILFYPGTMLAPGHYEVLISALRQAGFAVAGLHLSGHGKLRHINDFVFPTLLGEGLKAEAWLHKHGFGPVAVCGHSQGGILAVAHASASSTLSAAFSLCAVFPRMQRAISLTRFASLAKYRQSLLGFLQKMAAVLPGLPVPLPIYLELGRITAGKVPPLRMGKAEGRISYPLKYLVSFFNADISPRLNCPYWLCSARDDALFTQSITQEVFGAIKAPEKNLQWLEKGGHMAPLNPILAERLARSIACVCAGLGFPIEISRTSTEA